MLAALFALLPDFLDPDKLIDTFGLLGIFLIVFAESGLLVGFFLPGDSLLFTAGFLASGPSSVSDSLHLPLIPLLVGTWVAAVAGDQVGYLFGQRVGPALFRRPDSRFFKQENIDKAQAFFGRHGPKAIVLARFVPIVRTFTPITAGVSRMEYRTFVTFNLIGGTLWAFGVTLLGYFLGQIEVVESNLEIAILIVVAISCAPIVVEVLRSRRNRKVAAVVVHDLTDPDLGDLVEEARDPDGRV
ncbi:MAG: VTT domain-containing protein [Acidimicrobiales bacterium]